MPYIKKELRPIFDFAVVLASKQDYSYKTKEQNVARDLAVECIEFGVKDMPPEVMDGCLNYALTQIFRKIRNTRYAKIIVRRVISDLFWKEPKYFRYERVDGLLGCMINEYERRAWIRQRKVVKALKELKYLNTTTMQYYENKKIDENGDLE